MDVGYVNSWDIKEKEDIPPGHRIAVIEVSDIIYEFEKLLESETLSEVKLRIHDLVDVLEEKRT